MSLVAIVGRPNVGKSTFFNRLTEDRQSIVHDEPGVTRDRIYGQVQWGGRSLNVVDTGGFVPASADRFEAAIREQVHLAIEEASLILFVVDVTVGITELDMEMAQLLRRSQRPVVLVVNKADNDERRWDANEFYTLGFDEMFALSSINGMGTGDLLDRVLELLPVEPEPEPDTRPRIAFIGRPNVGKSSLTNALLGTDRSIVTEISGTTRDSIDSAITYNGRDVILVDTAGLRRKARIKENVEFYSWLRTERAIETCDVAVLLLDATEGLEAQDIRVLASAERMKKGLVIGINKWDIFEGKETNTVRDYERLIRERLKTLDYVPIVTMSAVTKQRIFKIMDNALAVIDRRKTRVPTSQLNDVLLPAMERHHPPAYRGHHVKIKYVTQVRADPPVFNFFCNYPKGIKDAYKRYLENQIREAFDFEGVPLTLGFKAKN